MNTKTFFNENLIENLSDKFCYLLGFIWADGYLPKGNNEVALEITQEDFDSIKNNFLGCGIWGLYERERQNRKPSIKISVTNKKLKDFLISMDYNKKSSVAPDKILNNLSEKQKSIWLLGFFDGDGGLYVGKQSLAKKKNKNWLSMKLSFYGSINQNWNFLEDICKKLDIKYNILKRKRKSGNSSSFVINGKNGAKMCGYFYKHSDKVSFLKRKKEKFDLFVGS